MQPNVLKLQELGKMPNHDEDISDEQLQQYGDCLHSIEVPINFQEAEILITLFPEEALYGLEWKLLHLFESVFDKSGSAEYAEKYRNLISQCPSEEWRNTLLKRLDNFIENPKDKS